MKLHVAAVATYFLVLAGCGGDSVVLPKEPAGVIPDPTPTTTTTSTPGLAQGGPTVRVTTNQQEGEAPLKVDFVMCQSRDERGGEDLEYTADFGNGRALAQAGCIFTNSFKSDGVSAYAVKVCVRDRRTTNTTCSPLEVKAWVHADVNGVADCNSSPPTLKATATLRLSGSSRSDGVFALSAIGKVVFRAVILPSEDLGTVIGHSTSNPAVWEATGWPVDLAGKTKLLRFTAIISSRDGNNQPSHENTVGPCGSP